MPRAIGVNGCSAASMCHPVLAGRSICAPPLAGQDACKSRLHMWLQVTLTPRSRGHHACLLPRLNGLCFVSLVRMFGTRGACIAWVSRVVDRRRTFCVWSSWSAQGHAWHMAWYQRQYQRLAAMRRRHKHPRPLMASSASAASVQLLAVILSIDRHGPIGGGRHAVVADWTARCPSQTR